MPKREVKTQYWHFGQNNSGGSLSFDEKRGITHHVVVEALSLDDAVSRAESIGLYWDGCETGQDCSCCGDRWYKPWKADGSNEPEVSGKHPSKFDEGEWAMRWMQPGKEICVHSIDGSKAWY